MKNYVKTTVQPSKRPRKCPMCGVIHFWPTDDKLCYHCEGEWVDFCREAFTPYGISFTGRRMTYKEAQLDPTTA
jgi:hypothetical protein